MISVNQHPGVENAITAYLHCGECLANKTRPDLAVGLTNDGYSIQVWCENHDINVALFEQRRNDEASS